jgi:zinc protease
LSTTAYIKPERTTVDGVPVFFLPLPGVLRAELLFRVGQVDEALPLRGISHIVEHLALHFRPHRPDWWRTQATVEPYVTRFSVRGEPGDITSFLAGVTSSLSDLPVERLPGELAILRTEEANRGGGSVKEIWSHRFGARGLGLSDYRQFGLKWLGPSDVRAWAEERFTAGNAALWISGDVPRDLRLSLRPGKRFPRQQVAPLDHTTPAFYQLGKTGVALSMSTDAGITTAYVLSEVLDDRVHASLRHAESLAYEAHVQLQAGGIIAFADALAENARDAAAALVAIVRDLAQHGHRPDELERALASNRAAREEPGAALESLTDAALFELGAVRNIISWDDYDREAAALTAADVAVAAEAALSTALLAIPDEVPCDIDGFTPLPDANGLMFGGSRVMATPGERYDSFIDYSDEGVSVGLADGNTYGIGWQDVAAALWWNDGIRTLIARDGSASRFVPDDWVQAEGLFEAIRVRVPPDRWVPMDEPTTSRPE